MSVVTDIRDEVYLRIATKKAALGYTYGNTFTLERTWRPYQLLDQISKQHPTGKVYVIGGNPIGYVNQSRTQMVLGEYSVMVGFQCLITDINSLSEIDGYCSFVQELEDTCRKEVDLAKFSFTRLEFLRDPDGVPFSFVLMREAQTFEAYFSAYYNRIRT